MTLELTPERYSAVYQALLAGDYAGAEARLANNVMLKLEENGAYDPDTKLYGVNQTVTVDFSISEFGLIRQAMHSVRWRGPFLRKAIEIMDWLDEHKTSK